MGIWGANLSIQLLLGIHKKCSYQKEGTHWGSVREYEKKDVTLFGSTVYLQRL